MNKATVFAKGFIAIFLIGTATASGSKGPSYAAKGQYYETCACAVSCPCATNEFLPTEGHCDAVMLFHLDKAAVGKTKLDGLNMAVVMKSPKNKKVLDSFNSGEMDHFAVYLDDKATDEQKAAFPELMQGMFGKMEIKGAKPPAFVPMNLMTDTDSAKLDAANGKLTFDIQNIKVGETKHGAKIDPKRIKMEGVVPFPWVGAVTQGKSKSFHYTEGKTKWDYKDRNAYFGEFSTKGNLQAAAETK